jgi:hypothetical protein
MSNNVPTQIMQGDTLLWTASYPDYPSSVWTLTVTLINEVGKIEVVGTPEADDSYIFEVDALTSAGYAPGNYRWTDKVTDGTKVYTLSSGCSTVLTDISQSDTFDGRSWAERALEAVEAVIENRASADQEAYSIQGRSLSRTPLTDLWNLRTALQSIVSSEGCAATAPGQPSNKKAVVRF